VLASGGLISSEGSFALMERDVLLRQKPRLMMRAPDISRANSSVGTASQKSQEQVNSQ
jgi:hypothetical protein